MIRYVFAFTVAFLFFLLFRELWRRFAAVRGARDASKARAREVAALTEEAMKAPGATPDRPIVVRTAALVEAQARSLPCVICDAEVTVEDHAVEVFEDEPLRAVTLHCRKCGHRRSVYVRVDGPRIH